VSASCFSTDAPPSAPSAALRVVIADDHPVVREGLRNLLQQAGIQVVGEATSGEDAVASVLANDPDVVLMDLSLRGLDGISAARAVHERSRSVVLVLTAFAERERVLAAVDAGVSGYLLKDDDPAELIAGIRAAVAGGAPFSPKVAAVLVEARAQERALEHLTARESEVLELVADGMSNKQIARALGISEGTVKAHLGSAFRRIGVQQRTQAALWMQERRRGWAGRRS
jgi:DNA-binding NarL/FixJ family response regulator